MKSTLALFSSARRDGNTGRLLDRIADELGLDVDLAAKAIAPYTYDHRHRGDDFEPLMNRLLTFDQVVFASPVLVLIDEMVRLVRADAQATSCKVSRNQRLAWPVLTGWRLPALS